MSGVGKTRLAPFLTTILLVVAGRSLAAAEDPALARGLHFLKGQAAGLSVGEMALASLAMLKTDVPPRDPTLSACLNALHKRFDSEGYHADRTGGQNVYEAAVVAMVLANLDAETRRSEIDQIARYLMGLQKPNGSWDYDNRTFGDTSISQYAVLGLWEASNAGADVPPAVFDRAARWFLSTQGTSGGYCYHRDDASRETLSMTAAGVGSLLICQRQLTQHRESTRSDAPSKLLAPLTPGESRAAYEPEITPARIEPAIKRGLAWLAANFTTRSDASIGPSIYYGLYGIERIGALADRASLGKIDWFEQGRRFILSSQQADGSWNSTHGEAPNTAWAMLFLTRSTAKTLERIEVKRLGAGTLLGGRGLPNDLSSLTVAGGRVVSRPMNGAVEGMLSVLEDPRARDDDADSALAGLLARYQVEGPAVLRPWKDRFRKLLTDRDPGLRRLSAWALSRTGDLDVVPDLIGALVDPDANVVETARLGLQLIGRKIEGLGPPSPSTPEQRQEAARRWRDWYKRTRPFDVDDQDDVSGVPSRPLDRRSP